MVRTQEFSCIDWECDKAQLQLDGEYLEVQVSPYSLPCNVVESAFECISSIEELERRDVAGKIAVLHGELGKEQLMPKRFPFYNPEHHKQLIAVLEKKNPLAIIAITSSNPELAGALYPFPLFEDGDFDIPSVYLTEEEGQKILNRPSGKISLLIESRRIPSRASNVIAVKQGKSALRVVVCAHIDTKKGTPGAIDNGAGVATLLTLADLLQNDLGELTVEIVLLNGEDYYSNPGEQLYLREKGEKLNEILLAVNIDGVGYRGHRTGFCRFACDGETDEAVQNTFASSSTFIEIEPWYQGDHMVFVLNGRPAIAFTSENMWEITKNIAHTAHDTIDLVDRSLILDIAFTLKRLLRQLDGQ